LTTPGMQHVRMPGEPGASGMGCGIAVSSGEGRNLRRTVALVLSLAMLIAWSGKPMYFCSHSLTFVSKVGPLALLGR
jgi:hypothetical protein